MIGRKKAQNPQKQALDTRLWINQGETRAKLPKKSLNLLPHDFIISP
jgi:hypothetical protein